MTFDTQALNNKRHKLEDYDELWVFGYASLIYKVDFEYLEQAPANINGYERRLWQGSSDHRGTPESPGRVATLVPSANKVCFGMAYKVSPDVFAHLDHREKNGYLREEISIELLPIKKSSNKSKNKSTKNIRGLVYMATPDNDAFLGDDTTEGLAQHIYRSAGPSGANKDYVYDLATALRKYGVNDAHIFAVEHALLNLEPAQ